MLSKLGSRTAPPFDVPLVEGHPLRTTVELQAQSVGRTGKWWVMLVLTVVER